MCSYIYFPHPHTKSHEKLFSFSSLGIKETTYNAVIGTWHRAQTSGPMRSAGINHSHMEKRMHEDELVHTIVFHFYLTFLVVKYWLCKWQLLTLLFLIPFKTVMKVRIFQTFYTLFSVQSVVWYDVSAKLYLFTEIRNNLWNKFYYIYML